MKNKEQLLYFFLQGAVSLSQYDYKFMANLQTMIQNQNRVTSNQAALFDKLISKYNKQLVKSGFVKEELQLLPWKTLVVESTSDYTGAVVSEVDDQLIIKVPFNKSFISQFRLIKNNNFEWSREYKHYTAPFSTTALKIAATTLPKFFSSVKYSPNLKKIVDELDQLSGLIWNPTLTIINGRMVVIAINSVLGNIINQTELSLTPNTLFEMSKLQIHIDPVLYSTDAKLEFAAKNVYEAEITDIETVISWMKNLGCENVVVGRGLRNTFGLDKISPLIEKYGMKPFGNMSFGKLPEGVSMTIQHTSRTEVSNSFSGTISKIVVLKDSRPVEVL